MIRPNTTVYKIEENWTPLRVWGKSNFPKISLNLILFFIENMLSPVFRRSEGVNRSSDPQFYSSE